MQNSTDRTEQDGLSSDAEDGGIVTRRAGKSPGGGEGGGGGGKSPGGGARRRRAGKGYMDMIHCLASQRYCGNYFNFKFSDILRVLVEIRGIFENEKMLIECQTPVVVVGDLHGQYTDLLRAFNLFNVGTGAKVRPGYLTQRFVFTGDYVDRGKQSLEVIMLLFLLKIKFKKSYLLLRGNHECKAINRVYGFKAELEERFDKDESNKLFHMFNEVFTYMPLACLVSGSILCMHGGIAPSATCLDDIRNIPKPLIDPPEDEIGCDLLWADPMIGLKGHRPNSVRGVSKHFGEDVLEDFMKRLDLTLVVRGHQMMMNGFNFFHDKRLVTVFTASSYYPDRANNGVVMYINREGRCGFKILTPQEEKGGKVFRGAHDDANAYDTGYAVFGEEKKAKKKGDSKRSEKESDDKKGKPRKSDSKRSEKEKEILKPIKSLFQNLK